MLITAALSFALLPAPADFQSVSDPLTIINGDAAGTCGWPTTVSTGGCTATLIHPKAISTAQHCGPPSAIYFGTTDGVGPSVDVLDCIGQGSQDAMICELAEDVTQVPTTPILFGCEVDTYLRVGQPVIIAGFGLTALNGSQGAKRWAEQTLTQVDAARVVVGTAGDGISSCYGDSGGPGYVQLDDGTWRVFGTTFGPTSFPECDSATDFQRLDVLVATFESQTGVDITPCFDGQSGAWDPGPDCGGFFAGDHSGRGSWDNWCAGLPAGGFSDACGVPFGEDAEGSTGEAPGETEGAAPTTGDTNAGEATSMGQASSSSDAQSGGTGGDSPSPPDTHGGVTTGSDPSAGGTLSQDRGEEGGCQVPSNPAPRSALFLLAMIGLARSRR